MMTRFIPPACGVVPVAIIMALLPLPGLLAQELPPPDQSVFQSELELLDFSEPTAIRGRIRFIDVTEQGVWLDWDQRLEVQPTGKKAWRTLEGQFMLLVYPKDAAQFEGIKILKPGTVLQFVIQSKDKGRRIILSFTEPAPPESPL
jgi:hypothetical protein